MSQPNKYNPENSFAEDVINNKPSRQPVDATALDAELKNASDSINHAIDNLALVQRDDGKLKDCIVDVHALSRDTLMLLGKYNLRGIWLLDTQYSVGDVVSNNGYMYVCIIPHRSNQSIETDNFKIFGFVGSQDVSEAAAIASAAAQRALVSESNAKSSETISTINTNTSTTAATTATTKAEIAVNAAATATIAATKSEASKVKSEDAAERAEHAASVSGISLDRIVYGDNISKTSKVVSANLAKASGFFIATEDVPIAGKLWLILNHVNLDQTIVLQRAIDPLNPNKEFRRAFSNNTWVEWVEASKSLADSITSINTDLSNHKGAKNPHQTAFSDLKETPTEFKPIKHTHTWSRGGISGVGSIAGYDPKDFELQVVWSGSTASIDLRANFGDGIYILYSRQGYVYFWVTSGPWDVSGALGYGGVSGINATGFYVGNLFSTNADNAILHILKLTKQ